LILHFEDITTTTFDLLLTLCGPDSNVQVNCTVLVMQNSIAVIKTAQKNNPMTRHLSLSFSIIA